MEASRAANVHRISHNLAVLFRDLKVGLCIKLERGVANPAVIRQKAHVVRIFLGRLLRQAHLRHLANNGLLQLLIHQHRVAKTLRTAHFKVLINMGDNLIHRRHMRGVRQLLAFRGGKHQVHTRCRGHVAAAREVALHRVQRVNRRGAVNSKV